MTVIAHALNKGITMVQDAWEALTVNARELLKPSNSFNLIVKN